MNKFLIQNTSKQIHSTYLTKMLIFQKISNQSHMNNVQLEKNVMLKEQILKKRVHLL